MLEQRKERDLKGDTIYEDEEDINLAGCGPVNAPPVPAEDVDLR